MIGVVLAAGRGSRMDEETRDKPKCLTEVAGRKLIDWQISGLYAGGVEQVAVVGGYKSELLEGRGNLTLENPRWKSTNMVATMCHASQLLEQRGGVISYSDIVFHPDHVRAILNEKSDIAITYDSQWLSLWKERFEDPLDDAETFLAKDGRLLSIGSRPRSIDEIKGQYMGLLKFSKDGWAKTSQFLSAIPEEEVDQMDMTTLLQKLLNHGVQIATIEVKGQWCEIDNKTDLDLCRRRTSDADHGRKNWLHDWRW